MSERPDPRRGIGRCGEELAAAHLERLGLRVLARNARTPAGEIDIVARDERALVFVEVKTRVARRRSLSGVGDCAPLESLRPRQRARLRRAAVAWMAEARLARPRPPEIRFDAIAVVLDAQGRLLRLEHLEGAW